MIVINSLIEKITGMLDAISMTQYKIDEEQDIIREGSTTLDEKLSGAHWRQISDTKWPNSTKIEDLDGDFMLKVQSFIEILEANKIKVHPTSTLRPKERAYLFHYCVEIKNGTTAPNEVPSMEGVDIIWDHGNLKKSKDAAKAMANAFNLVGPAALDSMHIQGKAIDMKMDFTKNTVNGINILVYSKNDNPIARTIIVDANEAISGEPAKHKDIPNIRQRELSKAGEDFGVIRANHDDVVHWSSDGT